MYCVIVGGGEVGFHIGSILIKEGHDVTLIDKDPENYRRGSEELDALVILGNGASKQVLRQAHIARANMLIAVTDMDEVNIVACMAAKHVGVPLTIARIRNPDYLDDVEGLSTEFTGIDYVIQPEAAVAEEVSRLAEYPGAVEVGVFDKEQVVMAEVIAAPESTALARRLLDVGLPRNVLVSAVLRGESMTIPDGEFVLRERDRVFLVGKPQGVREALKLLSLQSSRPRRGMLVGVGTLGLRIATALEARGLSLTIFEKDEDRATVAATSLHRSLVIHDEGLGESVLLQEGVRDADLFISATGDDRLNILSALQAKRLGARRTIAVVERAEFSAILEAAGVDIAISPRRITASNVLRFIRLGEVLSVALLDKSAGEVMELVVGEGSPLAGNRLRDVRFPKDAILGVLVQPDGVHVAHGNSQVNAGDRAIVFCLPQAVGAVERMFSQGA